MSSNYHPAYIVELHKTFNAPVAYSPTIPPLDRRKLRVKLILEELLEFIQASGLSLSVVRHSGGITELDIDDFKLVEPTFSRGADLIEAADGLGDLRVVIDGANAEWGFPSAKVLREIHRSNMSKVGLDGLPIMREDGKFLKGPNYTPPDIASIIELYSSIPREGTQP